MKDYKKIAFKRKVEGLEDSSLQKQKILSMVSNNNKVYFKKPILIFSVFIIAITLVLWPKQQSNDFYIIKVNANEYYVNVFEDGLQFDIYTLVKNDIIKYNDKYSYYKDMESHVDVSYKTVVKAHEFNGIKVLEVVVDGSETIYLEVYENENIRTIKEIEFEFTDFNVQMTKLSEMLKMFPPKEKIENTDENKVIHTFEYNEGVTGSPKEVNFYKWYVDGMKYFYDLRMSDYGLDTYALLIYMNGSKDKVESINHLINYSNPSSKEPFLNNPMIVNGDELYGLVTTPQEENDIKLKHYLNTSRNNSNLGYSSLIIDFSQSKYDVKNLDIDIKINNTVDVSEDDILILDNKLYVFPQTLYANDIGEIHMATKINIKLGDKVLLSYNDDFIANYKPQYHDEDIN